MLLRKINAGLSLLVTFLLMFHAIIKAVRMLSQGAVAFEASFLSWVLTGLMVIHAFISIDLVVSGVPEGETRKGKKYVKMNLSTLVQRVSGILLVIFTGLHIAGAIRVLQPPPLVHALLPVLFFTVALAHTAVSATKALVTLGIGNARFVKIADIAVKALCGATLIADVTGFYLYVC